MKQCSVVPFTVGLCESEGGNSGDEDVVLNEKEWVLRYGD